jgi:hypothetical protein
MYNASLHRLLMQANIEDLHRATHTFDRSDDSAEASEIDRLKTWRPSTYIRCLDKSVIHRAPRATRQEAEQIGSRAPATDGYALAADHEHPTRHCLRRIGLGQQREPGQDLLPRPVVPAVQRGTRPPSAAAWFSRRRL